MTERVNEGRQITVYPLQSGEFEVNLVEIKYPHYTVPPQRKVIESGICRKDELADFICHLSEKMS